jgi:hypothetical protein
MCRLMIAEELRPPKFVCVNKKSAAPIPLFHFSFPFLCVHVCLSVLTELIIRTRLDIPMAVMLTFGADHGDASCVVYINQQTNGKRFAYKFVTGDVLCSVFFYI